MIRRRSTFAARPLLTWRSSALKLVFSLPPRNQLPRPCSSSLSVCSDIKTCYTLNRHSWNRECGFGCIIYLFVIRSHRVPAGAPRDTLGSLGSPELSRICSGRRAQQVDAPGRARAQAAKGTHFEEICARTTRCRRPPMRCSSGSGSAAPSTPSRPRGAVCVACSNHAPCSQQPFAAGVAAGTKALQLGA